MTVPELSLQLTAVKYNVPLQNLYHRIMDKGTIKMKGYVVAVQRKLLVLMYTLWKKNEAYNNTAIKYVEQPQNEATLTELD